MNASGGRVSNLPSRAAELANDWQGAFRGLSNVEDVRITLRDPNSQLRNSLRMALQDVGFRNFSDGNSLRGIPESLAGGEIDLLIWDTSCDGGDVCELTHKIRHHQLGNNPFLPIITMVSDASPENIRKAMNTGPDDLLAKPLSTGLLFSRIMNIIERDRSFVVTSDYIGPDRRKKIREADASHIMQVPNPLRDRVNGVEDESELQRVIDESARALNDRKMVQHAIRIADQVDLILPRYANGEGGDEQTVACLGRLQYASEDLARRVTGTSFEFISELTMAMVDLVGRIGGAHLTPDPKDIDLLPELSRAIKAAFDGEEGAAELAQRISESVRRA